MIFGLLQLALVIHVVARSHAYGWIMALMACRLIGYVDPLLSFAAVSVVLVSYVVKEVWPGQRLIPRSLARVFNGRRDVAYYQQQLAMTGSVDSRLKLSQLYCEQGQFQAALTLLESAANGIYADDPVLLGLLAWAQLELSNPAQALATIDRLEQRDKPNEHTLLIKARGLEALGQSDRAIKTYESLLGRYSGMEPKARLALLLERLAQRERAEHLARDLGDDYQRAPRHVKAEQQRWWEATQHLRAG